MTAEPLDQNTDITGTEKAGLFFTLPAVMTIETAESLAAEFKQLSLAGKSTLTLDASQVENVTTPALQVFVSLEKTLAAQGGTLSFNASPDVLLHALKDAGLESLLKKTL